jgi:hypothetical protein
LKNYKNRKNKKSKRKDTKIIMGAETKKLAQVMPEQMNMVVPTKVLHGCCLQNYI